MNKFINKSHLKTMFFMLIFAASMPLFADMVPQGFKTVTDEIKEFFIGPIMVTIEICALIGCAIMYGINKDNDRMKKGVAAVGISILIIGAATQIVGAIFTASGSGK